MWGELRRNMEPKSSLLRRRGREETGIQGHWNPMHSWFFSARSASRSMNSCSVKFGHIVGETIPSFCSTGNTTKYTCTPFSKIHLFFVFSLDIGSDDMWYPWVGKCKQRLIEQNWGYGWRVVEEEEACHGWIWDTNMWEKEKESNFPYSHRKKELRRRLFSYRYLKTATAIVKKRNFFVTFFVRKKCGLSFVRSLGRAFKATGQLLSAA